MQALVTYLIVLVTLLAVLIATEFLDLELVRLALVEVGERLLVHLGNRRRGSREDVLEPDGAQKCTNY